MTDYQRGVEQASAVYQEVIREYVTENNKLRKLLADFRNAMWSAGEWTEPFDERMRELGVEV